MMRPRAIEENEKEMSVALKDEQKTLAREQAAAEYGTGDVAEINAKLRDFNARWVAAGGHGGACFVEVQR